MSLFTNIFPIIQFSFNFQTEATFTYKYYQQNLLEFINKMSHVKRREKLDKDTRWDRIRKRHQQANPLGLKTDAVRRFIEVDYVGKRQERLLIEGDEPKQLNPSVIMDMRHKMVRERCLYICYLLNYLSIKLIIQRI